MLPTLYISKIYNKLMWVYYACIFPHIYQSETKDLRALNMC